MGLRGDDRPAGSSDSRLVYSTDGGRVMPAAEARPAKGRTGQKAAAALPDDGVVRIMRDRKQRGGKTATVIMGLPGTEAELDALLKQLKKECGTGGTRAGRVLEIQGDQRERLQARLTALGHRVKLAGG
jgi:translation initiation factor 1